MTTAAAFPWKAEETAPSGSAPFYRGRPSREETGPPTLTKRRTEAEIKEEYDVLKGAGLPLQSMKLVLNEDLGALNEDASHVLDLNERLTRYALYVSELERANKELGLSWEAQKSEMAQMRVDHAEAQEAFGEERAQLVGQAAVAEAKTSEALAKVESVKVEGEEADDHLIIPTLVVVQLRAHHRLELVTPPRALPAMINRAPIRTML